MQDILNVVVAGEVDSGKSTLIGRFLYDIGSVSKEVLSDIGNVSQESVDSFEFAYLLDSLEEERKNKLTIDTTQAFCKTKKGKGFIFIDVPGHQELIKNMLCGSSYADIAVLVIDVQKSVEQQTKRHIFILEFLGIKEIIVVLNKMDLANFDESIFIKVKSEIIDFFKKLNIRPRYMIPISARSGENLVKDSKRMPWHSGLSFIETLNNCFKEKRGGNFRFPVQDIYDLNGKKAAVGRVISGRVKIGEKVKVLPLNKESAVKTIRVFGQNRPMAKSPESIALVLDDMDDLKRGQVICKSGFPRVDAEILSKILCIHNVKLKENLMFKCITQVANVQITKINKAWDITNLGIKLPEGALRENEAAEVTIVSENPVIVEKFEGANNLGRFVLGDTKEIYAVGIII